MQDKDVVHSLFPAIYTHVPLLRFLSHTQCVLSLVCASCVGLDAKPTLQPTQVAYAAVTIYTVSLCCYAAKKLVGCGAAAPLRVHFEHTMGQ